MNSGGVLIYRGIAFGFRCLFFFSSRRRHTRYWRDWSSDVCSSDLLDFDTKDPAGRVERLRDFGRRLYEQVFTQDIARLWVEHKQNHEFLVLCLRIDRKSVV